MVNTDSEIQVLKNGKRSRPNSPVGLAAPNGQGSESSEPEHEDEREGKQRERERLRDAATFRTSYTYLTYK